MTEFNEPETIHEEPDPDTTEVNDDDGEEDDQPDNEADEEADDGGSWDDDPEVAEILTITARKLAGVTQARKYGSGTNPMPKKTIAERKRNTRCSACGQQGHWAGDAECSASGKGSNKSTTYRDGGKNTGGGKGEKGKAKFAHFLNHYGGHEDDEAEPQHVAHAVLVSQLTNFEVCLTDATKAAGFIILDTACQRLCAGHSWAEAQKGKLNTWSIYPLEYATTEFFEFGRGEPIKSNYALYFPVCFGNHLCIMAPCILQAHIPCLASRTCLQDVGAVLDLSRQVARLELFDVTLPLTMVNGHLGLDVSVFQEQQRCFSCWHHHHEEIKQACHDGQVREFLSYPLLFAPQAQPHLEDRASTAAHGSEQATSAILAVAMEAPCSKTSPMGSASPEIPEKGTSAGSSRFIIDGSDGIYTEEQGQSKCQEEDPAEGLHVDQRLPSRAHQALREQARELRPAHGLRDQVEVEPRSPRMGALRKSIHLLTLATTFIGHCLGQFMEPTSIGLSGQQRTTAAPTSWQDYGTDNNLSGGKDIWPDLKGQGQGQEFRHGRAGLSSTPRTSSWAHPTDSHGGTSAKHRPGGGPRTMAEPIRGVRGGSHGSTTSGRLEPGLGAALPRSTGGGDRRLRLGRARSLINQITKASNVLGIEAGIYEALPTALDSNRSKVDIMELYAGHADITFLAHQCDLRAMEPFDLLYGKDMSKRKDKMSWRKAQQDYKPLLVVVETECTDWIIFNENLNYKGKDRMEELYDRRKLQYPLVEEGVQACYQQIADGNYFLFENPAPSRIWDLPRLQELAARHDVYVVQCHAGAYGGCNSHGDPIRKLYQWLTNSAELATALSRKLSQEELQYCVPLLGKEVRLSARYPEKMRRAILRALRVEARRRWPQRFVKTNEVFYEEPMQDPAAWMDVIRKVQKIFEGTTTKAFNLADNDPLHREICQLVPWEMVRIQLARAPAQRRLPRDILFTHRGAIIEYQDGQLSVEAEALDGMHFPKQRFAKAVAHAVFWYGFGEPKTEPPPEEQPGPSTAASASASTPDQLQPSPPPSSPISVVTFPTCPSDVPAEVKSAVRRLHLNLGHPTERELMRLLAYQKPFRTTCSQRLST